MTQVRKFWWFKQVVFRNVFLPLTNSVLIPRPNFCGGELYNLEFPLMQSAVLIEKSEKSSFVLKLLYQKIILISVTMKFLYKIY